MPSPSPDVDHTESRLVALRAFAVAILHNALLAGVYWAAARLGLMLDAVSGFATLVWAPSGIALAAVLLRGPQLLPGVLLGAFLANVFAGAPALIALGIAVGNSLEAVTGAYFLRRLGFRASLERVRDVLLLLVVAAIMSTLLSAAIGVSCLWFGDLVATRGIGLAFRSWWLGDLIGDLVVAPLLLVFGSGLRMRFTAGRVHEAILLASAVLFISLFAFHDWTPTAGHALRYTYALFPLVMWAGLRFEQPGATAITLLSSAVAVFGAVRGFGPFVYATLYERLFYLQAFMGVVALTGLFLGSATAERRRAREALDRERNDLEHAQLEAQRHAARVQTLADASRIYADVRLDLPRSLEAIARQVGEAIGDVCVIALLTLDGKKLEVRAVYHPDAAGRELLAEIGRGQTSPDRVPSGLVTSMGQPLLIGEATPQEMLEFMPAYRSYLERYPSYGLLGVPLRSSSGVLGAVMVGRLAPGRPYTLDDQLLMTDIAERAALAIENARLYQQAQDAIAVRDDFLAVASHELRTPLSAIVLQLSTLQQQLREASGPLAPEVLLARIDKAVRANDRLARLVDSLLDVSRIATRRMELQREEADLSEIARETVDRVQDQARAGNCELRMHADTKVVGFFDRLRIEQVLTNLLSNAIKYGPGQPIEVGVQAVDDRAVLTVRDYGIGIPSGDAERIFKPFERAVSVRNYGGLGLGLYIAREIVEAHGGVIRVDTEQPSGATFAIELPRFPLPLHGAPLETEHQA